MNDRSRWWWTEADANGNGWIDTIEFDAFYQARGITNVAYYGPSVFNVLHVAKKGDGNGEDCRASSKLGQSILMAHDLAQLEGGSCGNRTGGR